LTASEIELSILGKIPGRPLRVDEGTLHVPLTMPEIRRSNGKYLAVRGISLVNSIIRRGVLEVVGSPWLPGFWVLSKDEAVRVLHKVQEDSHACRLLLSVTKEPIKEKGWHSYQGDPMMVLEVQWENFEAYVASMKKKYRARVRKTFRNNEGVRWEVLDLNPENLRLCANFLESTLSDKVVALPVHLDSLLSTFVNCFGDRFKILGFYKEERLIGFISSVAAEDELRAMHFGAQEDAPEDFYSFAMFTLIEQGIAQKVKRINLGRTATEIKSTYGALAEENYFSFYSQMRVMQWLMRVVDKKYAPKPYTLRSPFGAE
jgi:predicted N-acyltransferase